MTESISHLDSDRILDSIRERPAMFLGNDPGISALWGFLNGYDLAVSLYTGGTVRGPLPSLEFGEWVAYRLGFHSSSYGWRCMILDRMPDESAALGRFFELLDEYRRRKPRIVARVSGYSSSKRPPQIQLPNGVFKDLPWSEMRPANLTLISYTDDPGLFIDSDEEMKYFARHRFFPTLKEFRWELGVSKEDITVLEPEIYARWLTQEDRFDTPSDE